MQSTLILLASAATLASAAANTTPIHARSLALFSRQDTMPSDECVSGALDLLSSFPTPAADVVSYLATAGPSLTSDACKITFPASLSDDVEEWVTSLSAFQSESSSALSSFVAECGGDDAAGAGLPVCASEPTFVYENGAGASGTAAATTAEETGSAETTTDAAGAASTAASDATTASDSTGATESSAAESSAAESSAAAGDDDSAAGHLTVGAAVAAVAGVVGLVAAL